MENNIVEYNKPVIRVIELQPEEMICRCADPVHPSNQRVRTNDSNLIEDSSSSLKF